MFIFVAMAAAATALIVLWNKGKIKLPARGKKAAQEGGDKKAS